jgi:hypothetical protein
LTKRNSSHYILSLSLGGPGDPDDLVSQAIDNAVLNGSVAVIAAVYIVGELFGIWGDDDEPYQPNIIMERVLLTRGNNDINAISPLWTHDLGYLKEECLSYPYSE